MSYLVYVYFILFCFALLNLNNHLHYDYDPGWPAIRANRGRREPDEQQHWVFFFSVSLIRIRIRMY